MDMSISSGVRNSLDPDFSCETVAKSLDSGIEKGNAYIGALTELVDTVPDDPDEAYQITKSQVINKFESMGVSRDTCLSCLSGFTTVGEAAEQIAAGLTAYGSDSLDSLNEIRINVVNAADQAVDSIGLLDMVDEIKENIAAAVCAKTSIMSSLMDSVADRAAKFAADLSGQIDENYTGYSSIISYYRSLCTSTLSPLDIVSQIFSRSGSEQLAAGDPVTLKDMDVSAYTGANPLGALSFTTYKTVAAAVGKVLGAACVAIWNGVKSGVSWVWNKASKFVNDTFIDPYDVVDSGDSKASHSFSGFQYQMYWDSSQHTLGYYTIALPFGSESDYSYNEVIRRFNSSKGSWYYMKTIGGEMAIRWDEFIWVVNDPSNYTVALDKVTMVLKPYAVADDVLQQFRVQTPTYFQYPCEYSADINDVNLALASRPEGIYLDAKASESDLANAFMNGFALNGVFLHKMAKQMIGESDDDLIRWATGERYTSSSTINNYDWMRIACGYDPSPSMSGQVFQTFPKYVVSYSTASTQSPTTIQDLYHLSRYFMYIIACTIARKSDLGNNFSGYIPYTKDSNTMTTGRFSIKTDTDNQALAENFLSVMIAVAIVVAVVITGVVIAKKISRRLFWKRTEFVGRSDNAMWNGKTLSPSDRRKYLRYKRKLEGTSSITKGLAGSSIIEAIQSIDLSGPVAALNGTYAGADPNVQVPTIASLKQQTEVDNSQLKRLLK